MINPIDRDDDDDEKEEEEEEEDYLSELRRPGCRVVLRLLRLPNHFTQRALVHSAFVKVILQQ